MYVVTIYLLQCGCTLFCTLSLVVCSLSLSVISSDRYERQLCLIKTRVDWLMRWELVDKAEVESSGS